MKTIWCTLALGIALLLQPWSGAVGGDKEGSGKGLAGMYRLVSGEKDGERIPAKEIEGSIVRFTADTIIATDRDKKETYAATYKLDGDKITMTSIKPAKGLTTQGLVKIKGDSVHLIYALPDEKTKEVGKAPTDFKTQKGQLMVVLERVKE